MILAQMSCEIHRQTIQKIKESLGERFCDHTFYDINSNPINGSQFIGDDGCDIRRKLGWSDISCTCPAHNQKFLLVDENTGEPLVDVYYEIKSKSSEFVSGQTDAGGYTEKVHVWEEEEIEITVFAKE